MVVLNILSSLPGYRLPSILLMVRFGGWKEFFQPFQKVQELPIHITAYGCQVLLSGVMADLESSHSFIWPVDTLKQFLAFLS